MPTPKAPTRAPDAKAVMNRLADSFDRDAHHRTDPIYQALRLERSQWEVGGLISAMLAFGRVASINAKLNDLFDRLDRSPARAVVEWKSPRLANALKGWNHRWIGEKDIARFLLALGAALREHEDLQRSFIVWGGEGSLIQRASHWMEALEARAPGAPTRGSSYLFSSPANGGAAKRLMLYFRWMVRSQPPDMGLWTCIDPSELIIPLDTHLSRIGRNLGWVTRKSDNLKTALEITQRLAQFDPADPTRYDFALSHMGIENFCPPHLNAQRGPDRTYCAPCPLLPICPLGALS